MKTNSLLYFGTAALAFNWAACALEPDDYDSLADQTGQELGSEPSQFATAALPQQNQGQFCCAGHDCTPHTSPQCSGTVMTCNSESCSIIIEDQPTEVAHINATVIGHVLI